MRRPSLTPRRNSIKSSFLSSINISTTSNSTKRRDTTLVRNKQYQAECFEKLYNFLAEIQYEDLKLIRRELIPSSKTFNKIFERMIFYVQHEINTPFIKSVEPEIFSYLKFLEYPHLNEINRSQIKSITPHSWPVLLSMLAWLSEIINENSGNNSIFDQKEPKTLEETFNLLAVDSYLKFMEGEDDIDDSELKTKLDNFMQCINTEIKNQQQESEKLTEEIERFKNTEKNELLKENAELNNELEKNRQINQKYPKRINSVESSRREIELEIQSIDLKTLRNKKEQLEIEHRNQTKKIETMKLINERYKTLNTKLNKIEESLKTTKIKGKVMKNENNDLNEELEKIVFNIKNLHEFSEDEEFEKFNKQLEISYNENLKLKNQKETKFLVLQEQEDNLKNEVEKFTTSNNFYNDNLLSLGKIFIEKKSKTDNFCSVTLRELQKIQSEIAQHNTLRNQTTIQVEQSLRQKQIDAESLRGEMEGEESSINNIVNQFLSHIKVIGEQLAHIDDEIIDLANNY